MNRAVQAASRAHARIWGALRSSDLVTMLVIIAAYLGLSTGLRAAGYDEAAWAATIALGVPIVVLAWSKR